MWTIYLWADGIHVNIRLEEHEIYLLVSIGVRADDRKELVALADGYRESTESRADLLRDAPARDADTGAPGRRPRSGSGCLARGNVPSAPPTLVPARTKALAEIWNAENRRHALAPSRPSTRLTARSSAKPSRRSYDVNELIAFFDYPAEHWVHLRTTNPIESTSATARRSPKDQVHAQPALLMTFKLIESAQALWRAVNSSPDLQGPPPRIRKTIAP